jgi:hypothetical protein
MKHILERGDRVRINGAPLRMKLMQCGFITEAYDVLAVDKVDPSAVSSPGDKIYWCRNPELPALGSMPIQACFLGYVPEMEKYDAKSS